VLPAAIAAAGAGRGLICPAAQGGEAAWAGELAVLAPTSIIALVNHFKGSQTLAQPAPQMEAIAAQALDLADIKGHDKR
jgi:magnesium chelatase family protein